MSRNTGFRLIAVAILVMSMHLLMPFAGWAQSAFLDEAQTGVGAEIGGSFDGTEFEAVDFESGYSINSIVDLGIGLVTRPGRPEGRTGTEFVGSLAWTVMLLKQTRRVPFSVALDGEFSATVVRSDSLRDKGLRERGTGYTVGMEAFQYHRLRPRLYARLGALGRFESATFVTDRADGQTDEEFPRARARERLEYGAIIGVSWRPNRPDEGVAISFDARVLTDPNLSVRVEPTLSFTLVRDRPSGEWR